MSAELISRGLATRLNGPLLFVRRRVDVGLNEAVEVMGYDGHPRLGRIAALDEDFITVQVLESTAGLSLEETAVRFIGRPHSAALGPGILGRVFNGMGRVIDGGPPVPAVRRLPIEGRAINPVKRANPADFIETGVSAIDLMNSLVRGQKLPIFSGGGLPHDRLALDIAINARLRNPRAGGEHFAIVFAGIGVPFETADLFRRTLERSGSLERTALFLNLASDSSVQRLLTPRYALTAAEYLAFVEGRHVLVIMTDMTNYCEALREVSASHGEIPSRKGYPGYMYSDLASLFERAGWIRGRPGTLTQFPILTMPGDDMSHPIPDLTGYITEGQIVLDRTLDRQGIYPPIKVLPSLSRLMKDGIGPQFTHPAHQELANQLYASYARSEQMRTLANVVGADGLTEGDRRYLSFGERFEEELVAQQGPRSLDDGIAVGWRLLSALPERDLTRLSDATIQRWLRPAVSGERH